MGFKFKWIFSVVVVIVLLLNFSLVLSVEPFGAQVTERRSERAPNDTAQSIFAQAGNVTEMDIIGFSITQSWQGYFGNVSGTITLGDLSDNVLYNWSAVNPSGEVYATNATLVSWVNIQCFNFTATGTYASDVAQRGATSLYGTNLSLLENWTGIAVGDVDGVDETFTLLGSGHDIFYTNNLEFAGGECRNTRLFGDTGAGVDGEFEEVLLYDPDNQAVIFTSLIENSTVLGFDDGDHDFELIVLENGHSTDVAVTNYYFYLEIQ